MREWFSILVPIALIGYFVAYPGQFTAFVSWIARLFH
jgi:hypothetical protein